MENEKKVSTETIARTIALGVVLVNQVCVAFGWSPLPFEQEAVYAGVSTVLTASVSVWAWWKNNSITKPAIASQEVFKLIREGSVTVEQIMGLVKK